MNGNEKKNLFFDNSQTNYLPFYLFMYNSLCQYNNKAHEILIEFWFVEIIKSH